MQRQARGPGKADRQIAGHIGTSSLSEDELRLAQAARRFGEELAVKVKEIGTELGGSKGASQL